MKMKLGLFALAAGMMASTAIAHAEGELNIFNWGNYTSPEMIKKFEEAYKVKVTVTDYDSNDTALAKIRQGGHGFDIVVQFRCDAISNIRCVILVRGRRLECNRALAPASFSQEQRGAHPAQPAVARVAVVTRMPVLLDRE